MESDGIFHAPKTIISHIKSRSFLKLTLKYLPILHLYVHSASAAVIESIGTFKILVCRHGKLTTKVRVRVETIDGSANEGEDYQAINEILTFDPYETEKEVIF